MYYNPETKETISKEALQNLLNASFPQGTLLIDGWHLVDEKALYPHLLEGQYAEPTGIIENGGAYARSYAVRRHAKPIEIDADSESIIKTQAEKISLLEAAVQDLAQMVSNLEGYRKLDELEKIARESAEEES